MIFVFSVLKWNFWCETDEKLWTPYRSLSLFPRRGFCYHTCIVNWTYLGTLAEISHGTCAKPLSFFWLGGEGRATDGSECVQRTFWTFFACILSFFHLKQPSFPRYPVPVYPRIFAVLVSSFSNRSISENFRLFMRTPSTDTPLPLSCIWFIALSKFVKQLYGDKGCPCLDPLVVLNHGPKSLPMCTVIYALLLGFLQACKMCFCCVESEYLSEHWLNWRLSWSLWSNHIPSSLFFSLFLLLVLGLLVGAQCCCFFTIQIVHLKWRPQSVILISLILIVLSYDTKQHLKPYCKKAISSWNTSKYILKLRI